VVTASFYFVSLLLFSPFVLYFFQPKSAALLIENWTRSHGMITSLGVASAATESRTAPSEVVRTFNECSSYFEEKLVDSLEYGDRCRMRRLCESRTAGEGVCTLRRSMPDAARA